MTNSFRCLLNVAFTLVFGIALLFDVYSQTGPGGVGNSTSNKIWLKADEGIVDPIFKGSVTLEKTGGGANVGYGGNIFSTEAVCNVLVVTLLSVVNPGCKCYEGITDTKDIYVLYVKDSVSELKYLSNFHGQYTLFEYSLKLSKGRPEIEYKESSNGFMAVTKKDEHFYVIRKLTSSEYTVNLRRKNCKKLKINKIPKERISKNPYPD